MAAQSALKAMFCCWVCHKRGHFALSRATLPMLGMYAIHRDCFAPGVFGELATDCVVVSDGLRTKVVWRNEATPGAAGRFDPIRMEL